jgi:2-hydroxychromene-2-carboxylate isomerase
VSLFKILEKCEVDINFFNESINQQKIKDELKELTSNAFEMDIFGAPTFIVNKKLFWGQDRLNYALDEYNS